METEGSLLWSQKPSTIPYPGLGEYCLRTDTQFL